MTFLSTLGLLLAAGAPAITAAQSSTSQPSFFLQDPSDGKQGEGVPQRPVIHQSQRPSHP